MTSAPAPVPSSRNDLNELRSQLQHLATLAWQETDRAAFLKEFMGVLASVLETHRIRVWLGETVDKLVEAGSQCHPDLNSGTGVPDPIRPEYLEAILSRKQARLCSTDVQSPYALQADQSGPTETWVMMPLVGTTRIHGVVACEWRKPRVVRSPASVIPPMQSIIEASFRFFEAQYIRELMGQQRFDGAFEESCCELHRDPSLNTTPPVIAAEFLRMFQSDRTWVLMPKGYRWRVKAVGGVPGFQRRASVVRKLEKLVATVARTKQSFLWSAGKADNQLGPRLRRTLDQYLDEVHVGNLRIEPLFRVDSQNPGRPESSSKSVIGAIVCEWYQPSHFSTLESRWKLACQQAQLALQNAWDWSRAPVARTLRGWRRKRSWFQIFGWSIATVLVLAALTLAALTPIDFTISAMGELQPTLRRHVFATSTGIVRQLSVTSGAKVAEGAPLLELDSPELELEIRRAEGELQTTEKKLTSIEASRLDFGASQPDSSVQINTLAGEWKEQQQKRDNLRRELELLAQRRSELKVISPIQGRVVTWDLERSLAHRPVARGQRLLTISDTEGPWEVALRVADEDTSDLFQVMKEKQRVPIDFIAITMPQQVFKTELKSLSKTVEIHSPGDPPSLLCLADAPESLWKSAVEGMSVRGRLHCGQRPAIHVLFHKFWRAIREHVLFQWGW